MKDTLYTKQYLIPIEISFTLIVLKKRANEILIFNTCMVFGN